MEASGEIMSMNKVGLCTCWWIIELSLGCFNFPRKLKLTYWKGKEVLHGMFEEKEYGFL